VVGTPQGKLMLVGYPHNGDFKCSVNDLDVANLTLADHNISDNFIMNCELTSDNSAQAFVNTNYNGGDSIGPFLVASKSYVELTQKIEDLSNKLHRVDIITVEAADTQVAPPERVELPNICRAGGCNQVTGQRWQTTAVCAKLYVP
jgi:hypothetical protein